MPAKALEILKKTSPKTYKIIKPKGRPDAGPQQPDETARASTLMRHST